MATKTKLVLSVSETAEVLGVCETTVYRSVRLGRLPYIRIGRNRILIPLAALERMLEIGEGWNDAGGNAAQESATRPGDDNN